MGTLSAAFALVRYDDKVLWRAEYVPFRGKPGGGYRITGRGTRDAFDQAEILTDIETVAQRVILDGLKMRCRPNDGRNASLGLDSKGVKGYRLDPTIAKKLGVIAQTA